jgi:hypothetical protein
MRRKYSGDGGENGVVVEAQRLLLEKGARTGDFTVTAP